MWYFKVSCQRVHIEKIEHSSVLVISFDIKRKDFPKVKYKLNERRFKTVKESIWIYLFF